MKYFNREFFTKLKGKLKIMKEKSVRRLTVLSLATILLVSGCGVHNNVNTPINTNSGYYQESYTSISNSSNTQETTITVPEIKSELSEESLITLEKLTSISEQDYNNFVSYTHAFKVDYENSKYFQIDEALDKYKNINEYETISSNFIKDGKLEEEALKRRILDNNNQYFADRKSGRYSLLDSTTFDKVFNALVDSINYQLARGTDIDIAQLDDNLTNLRLFRMTSPGSGMVTDDGILAVNLEVIATRQLEYPNVDYLRMTVIHEGNHLMQISSVKEREEEGYSKNLGIAYSWDDLKVNPLLYTWYTESSAEYLKYYQYGEGAENTSYENQVKALEMLTLTTMLKDGADETTFAKLSFQSDLNKLFTLFNCQDDTEKLEILNMMYALEICLNQPTEFTKFYKEQTSSSLDIYSYQDSLKSSIAQTLTKRFYENLASYMKNNQISLKSIFSMISSFEVEMNRFTKYSNDYYIGSNESFINMYKEIQGEYFEILSNSLDMSIEELSTLYNSYYHDGIANVNNATLETTEEDFINRLLQSRQDSRKYTINEIGITKIK